MPSTPINSEIRRLRRRVRLLLVERGALFGATGGEIGTGVIVLLSSRFDSLIDYYLWGATVACGAILGAAWGLLRRLDDLAVAIAADKRVDLRERLSTALALQGPGDIPDMGRAAVDDAIEHVSALRSREVFRHRFGLPHAVFGGAAVLLMAAILLPLAPAFQSKMRRAEVRVMKREGAKLIKIAKEIKRETGLKHAELKKLGNRLYDLGRKMESGRMSKKQAMLQTRRLTKEVEKQQDELARRNAAARSMEQAKLDMKKAGEDLAKQMAAKLAAKGKMPFAEAMKKLPSDPKLAELANKAGALTPAEQKALEEALSKYADPKNALSIPTELGQALAKLMENKDYRKAMQILQKLALKLNSGKMSPADREALQKQLQALAKALKGTDLDKLAKMMLEQAQKLAAMSPEELAKLLKELEEMQKMAKLLGKAGHG